MTNSYQFPVSGTFSFDFPSIDIIGIMSRLQRRNIDSHLVTSHKHYWTSEKVDLVGVCNYSDFEHGKQKNTDSIDGANQ